MREIVFRLGVVASAAAPGTPLAAQSLHWFHHTGRRRADHGQSGGPGKLAFAQQSLAEVARSRARSQR